MNIELSGVSKAELKYLECNDLDIEVSGVCELRMNGQADQLESGDQRCFHGLFDGKTITFADIDISGSGYFPAGKGNPFVLNISGAADFNGPEFEVEL